MTVFSSLDYGQISRLRKFVQSEHMKAFGTELPKNQVDNFIESYWGEYMENELAKVVDKGFD
jgi:hypothetical protein